MSVASLGASPSRPPRAPRPLSTHSSTHRNSPNISGNPPELHVSPPLPSISTLALSVKANHSSSHVVTPLKRGASLPKDGSPYEEHTVATRTPSETGHDPSPSETFFTASVFRYQTTTDSGIAGLSRKNSSIRDSSETHAVTIYDMYSEEGPSMGREDMSRNETRSFSSRPASSFFDPNISDDYRPSGNSLRASVSLLPYAQPPTPPDPQQRTSLTNSVRTARESFQQSFQQSSRVTTPINALEPPRPPSRTRLSNSASYGSLRPNFSRPRTPSNPTAPPHLNSSHSSLNLPPGTSTSTPARPTQTAAPFKVSSNRSRPSTSHSHSQRGSTEEPDSFHVRVTYARLEAQGVEGDGFDEGVERTRTKPANASSTSIRPAEAPLDPVDKGVDLTGRQVELLQDLDRYGFFATAMRMESRVALLPALPLQKIAGGRRASAPASTSSSPIPPELVSSKILPIRPIVKESTRLAKWNRMMRPERRDEGANVETWSFKGGLVPGANSKAERRVWKGIPDMWRAGVWWTLIESKRATREHGQQIGWKELARIYRDGMDKPSTFDIQIDLDVPRTISGHILFHTRYGQGQRSLFHVLHCFSLKCSDCGYVQGMGLIAATLLCYLEPERVYASMVRLHDEYEMHSIFQPGFPGMLEGIYVQERLIERFMPDVYQSFTKHMISTTSYATKWYITLFANTLPFQTQLRLWDAFLLEGRDVIVIVAVAIVWVLRAHLASACANLETILSLLSSFFVAEDEDALMQWVHKILNDKKIRADMRQWRTDWHGLVARGEDARVLL